MLRCSSSGINCFNSEVNWLNNNVLCELSMLPCTSSNSSSVLVLSSYGDTKGYAENISSELTSDGIFSDVGDQYKAVIEKAGSGYTIYVTGVGYIGLENDKNALNMQPDGVSGNTRYQWKITYKDGGSVWLTNVAFEGRRLKWNSDAN